LRSKSDLIEVKVGVVMDKHEQALDITENANAETKSGSAVLFYSAGGGDRSLSKTSAAVLLLAALATALKYDVTVFVDSGTEVTVLIDIRRSGTI
jgi:hypothetical protein